MRRIRRGLSSRNTSGKSSCGQSCQHAGRTQRRIDAVPTAVKRASVEAGDLATDSREADVALRLERGDGAARVYFSDLTAEYVRINSEYST